MRGTENYHRQMENMIEELSGKPTLALHSCCAPCSSHVLSVLTTYFKVTVLYYNPNIYPPDEYEKRLGELYKLVEMAEFCKRVNIVRGEYSPESFLQAVKGLEKQPEGGLRCLKCYEMRLERTAMLAKAGGFDYFTTTLSVSPHKNAEELNRLGEQVAKEYGVRHLPSDFKKSEGYRRSIELSKMYGLYRQDYCGCIYSIRGEKEIDNT